MKKFIIFASITGGIFLALSIYGVIIFATQTLEDNIDYIFVALLFVFLIAALFTYSVYTANLNRFTNDNIIQLHESLETFFVEDHIIIDIFQDQTGYYILQDDKAVYFLLKDCVRPVQTICRVFFLLLAAGHVVPQQLRRHYIYMSEAFPIQSLGLKFHLSDGKIREKKVYEQHRLRNYLKLW